MSEKTREVEKFRDTMYTQSLCGETIGTIWPMDLVFMSTFDNQSMSIGCVGKLGHLSGFLRHYLLIFAALPFVTKVCYCMIKNAPLIMPYNYINIIR